MAEADQSVDELVASLEGRIVRLQKHLPQKKAPLWPTEPALFLASCPECKSEMKSCRVTVNREFCSLEWFGLFVNFLIYLDGYFRPWVKDHPSCALVS
jgi:hypothetical protein